MSWDSGVADHPRHGTFALDSARDGKRLAWGGFAIYVVRSEGWPGNSAIARPDDPSGDGYPLFPGAFYEFPDGFKSLYLTHDASAGNELELLVLPDPVQKIGGAGGRMDVTMQGIAPAVTPAGRLQVAAAESELKEGESIGYASLRDENDAARFLGVGNYLWNGASADVERGNNDRTILASATRSALSSTFITIYNARRAIIFTNATASDGDGTQDLNLILQVTDPVSGVQATIYNQDIFTNGTTGFHSLMIDPHLSAAPGSVDAFVASALYRNIRVRYEVQDGGASPNYTYSSGIALGV